MFDIDAAKARCEAADCAEPAVSGGLCRLHRCGHGFETQEGCTCYKAGRATALEALEEADKEIDCESKSGQRCRYPAKPCLLHLRIQSAEAQGKLEEIGDLRALDRILRPKEKCLTCNDTGREQLNFKDWRLCPDCSEGESK